MSKDTLIVNLYAGPGAGKSTAAAYIFSKLKMAGLDVEYVTEYAKDKTWEDCKAAFACQLYINAKQVYRIARVYGKVDVIVTDSPILLGAAYSKEPHIMHAAICEDKRYTNRLDYFLCRDRSRAYNENGRNQTLEEAQEKDNQIARLMRNHLEEGFELISSNEEGYNEVIEKVLEKVGR